MTDSGDWDFLDEKSSATFSPPSRCTTASPDWGSPQHEPANHIYEDRDTILLLSGSPCQPYPGPLPATLNDELKDHTQLKHSIPGYMLEPTKSYEHWVVDRELFVSHTDRDAFSATQNMAAAYGDLLHFLYRQESKALSPTMFYLVRQVAKTLFPYFGVIDGDANPKEWPTLNSATLRSAGSLRHKTDDDLGLFEGPIECILAKLDRVIFATKGIRAYIAQHRAMIHQIVLRAVSTQRSSVSTLSEALQLVDRLYTVYNIVIVASEQLKAAITPIPGQFQSYHLGSGCHHTEYGVFVPLERVPEVYHAYVRCFRPNQQTLAPLLNDARWPHVSPPAPPADKGRNLKIAIAAGVVGGAIVTPLLGPAVLGIVGFSSAGPVAGSIAAYIQAGIGNVAVGSAFAGAQAAAMGAGVPFFGQAIGGALVGGGTYLARKFRGESS
ncbi:hypothetical protein BDV98DRAFT_574325 [Pterulicium gracile]|uniref:Uncharacterized protein n=1 Tax=Pterulicium gracile TaxID=1884261 RepID=A0A5C3Q727_9AGAR|nr:hypothetical protein BDV98DRAFT_574325 [Pterula gracilis]